MKIKLVLLFCMHITLEACLPASSSNPVSDLFAHINIADDLLMRIMARMQYNRCEIQIDESKRQARLVGYNALDLNFNPGYTNDECTAFLHKPVSVVPTTLMFFGEGRPYQNDSSFTPWTGEITVDLVDWNGSLVPKDGWSAGGRTYCQRNDRDMYVWCKASGPFDAGP